MDRLLAWWSGYVEHLVHPQQELEQNVCHVESSQHLLLVLEPELRLPPTLAPTLHLLPPILRLWLQLRLLPALELPRSLPSIGQQVPWPQPPLASLSLRSHVPHHQCDH